MIRILQHIVGTIVKYFIMLISKNKNIIINDATIPMIILCYVQQ